MIAGFSQRACALRRPSEYAAVLKSGVRVSTPNFAACALANAIHIPRLGTIAGKKAAPRAVDRNRGKRLIREAFRVACSSMGSYDVTVQMRSDLRAQKNGVLRAELQQLLDILMRRCLRGLSQPEPPSPSISSDRL